MRPLPSGNGCPMGVYSSWRERPKRTSGTKSQKNRRWRGSSRGNLELRRMTRPFNAPASVLKPKGLLTGSELQLEDKLQVAGATIAEVRIKRVRRAGQTEARTESRRRVGEVRMVPYVEKFSAQAQPPVTRDLLRFDKGHVKIIQPRSAESVSSQIAVSPGHRLRENCWVQIWP